MEPTRIVRSSYGRFLTGATAVGAVLALVSLVVSDGAEGLARYGAIPVLATVLVWAAFWRPEVRVAPAGVTVVNVWSTTEIPWADLTEVTTRWALELHTTGGRVSAWAVPPASGTVERGLRRTAREPDDQRPTADNVAALIRAWDERDTGHQGVRTTWHVATVLALASLAVLGTIALRA